MTQRSRDLMGGPTSLDYFMRRAADGWTLAAVEWDFRGVNCQTRPKRSP